jgi:hypothetical protein
VPGGRLALRSGVLAKLRASSRYLLTNGRRYYTEGKYGASSQSTPTTSTEHDPLERLAELTDDLPRITPLKLFGNPNGLHSGIPRGGKTRREAPILPLCDTKNTRSRPVQLFTKQFL